MSASQQTAIGRAVSQEERWSRQPQDLTTSNQGSWRALSRECLGRLCRCLQRLRYVLTWRACKCFPPLSVFSSLPVFDYLFCLDLLHRRCVPHCLPISTTIFIPSFNLRSRPRSPLTETQSSIETFSRRSSPPSTPFASSRSLHFLAPCSRSLLQ